MAQWIKNLTAVAQVTEEAQVQSLAWCSRLKDLALSQLLRRFKLKLRFTPLPKELPHVIGVVIKKKKKGCSNYCKVNIWSDYLEIQKCRGFLFYLEVI